MNVLEVITETDKNLLYLDDEEENLDSFSLCFMDHYNIYTTSSAEEAFRILETEDIHVVLTDQRMPGVTGLEFLKKIRPSYPNIVSMIVSGYSDTEVIIKALNEAGIYQYVPKPWTPDALKMSLDNAFERYELRLKNQQLITDLKESNQLLARKIEQLDMYIYRASHDLKGYLTRFLGLCLNGLREFQNAPPFLSYLHFFHQEAKNMHRMLQNHLVLHTLENEVEPHTVVVVEDLVQQVCALLVEQEGAACVSRIEMHYALNTPTQHLSPHLLHVLLYQLLHNALIFSEPTTPVLLQISEETSKNELQIRITDRGIGIAEEAKAHVFEQFYRATNYAGGNGLGLYLARLAADKLRANISFESQEGQGSVFCVKIPR